MPTKVNLSFPSSKTDNGRKSGWGGDVTWRELVEYQSGQ